MSNPSQRPSLLAPIAGVIAGFAVYIGVNLTTGHAIVPTVESVTSISHGLSEPNRTVPYFPVTNPALSAGAAGGAYQTVCQACHQADGKGLPGAFPPLAGSSWMTQDPETPVRIVLLGLSGEIDVSGTKYNAVMPPPPAMTDEQVVEAINHARTSFGNTASTIDVDLVKTVRASLAGRTQSWTAAELLALRTAPAEGGVAPIEAAPTPGAAPEAAPVPDVPAAPAAPIAAPAPK